MNIILHNTVGKYKKNKWMDWLHRLRQNTYSHFLFIALSQTFMKCLHIRLKIFMSILLCSSSSTITFYVNPIFLLPFLQYPSTAFLEVRSLRKTHNPNSSSFEQLFARYINKTLNYNTENYQKMAFNR